MSLLELLSRKPVSVVGFRGAAGLEPENTLRAIRRALVLGVDAVLLDARSTADRRLVLASDDNLYRLAGVDAAVSRSFLEDLRSRVSVLGEPLATLEEALAEIGGRAGAIIRVHEARDLKLVLDALASIGASEWSGVLVGDEAMARAARVMGPEVEVGLLYSRPGWSLRDAEKAGCSFVVVDWRLLGGSVSSRSGGRAAVLVYGADDEASVDAAIRAGVDGLVTARPDLVLSLVGERF